MLSLEIDVATEAQGISARARITGPLRFFLYRGNSMTPTFHPGHLLYVRPTACDITVGDVIVFANLSRDGYVVHRIVSATDAGLVTRGDNNLCNDLPVAPGQVVGRVEMVECQGSVRPVRGGRRGLWSARLRWGTRRVGSWLRCAFRTPYCALRNSPTLRQVLNRLLSRHLRVLHLETPDGPLVKTTYRGHTIARWWPQANCLECRKPYDLVVSPPSDLKGPWTPGSPT
jgi:signal peptidase I